MSRAPSIARAIAKVWAEVMRSDFQSRRTRIATSGYVVVKGTTIATGPSPIARNIVMPAAANSSSGGWAASTDLRSQGGASFPVRKAKRR